MKMLFVLGLRRVFDRLERNEVPEQVKIFPTREKETLMRKGLFFSLGVLLLTVAFGLLSCASTGGGGFNADGFNAVIIDGNSVAITGNTEFSRIVTIPETINEMPVTAIGANAFINKQLISVTIPNSVTSIGHSAFSGNQLATITIPNSVFFIDHQAFMNNQLTSVTIPDGVSFIGIGGFRQNQLTSIIIPDSIFLIGPQAFRQNQLTSVTIPNSVTFIGDKAFAQNQLTSVTIGANVRVGADSIDGGFGRFYNKNGKKAGIYIFTNGTWSMQ